MAERYGDRALLISDEDGSEFGVKDCEDVMCGIALMLANYGLRAGDCFLTIADHHPELVLVLWAAWRSGLVPIPIDPKMSISGVLEIAAQTGARLVFADSARELHADATGLPKVVFDSLASDDGHDDFATQLDPFFAPLPSGGDPQWPALSAGDPAVILFTSGSSGAPKGVELSHGSLFSTGRILADAYSLTCLDVMLSLGSFHAMSGLRNPCFAALHGGATIVLASEATRRQAVSVADVCRRHTVTTVCAVPSFLTQLEAQRSRMPRDPLRSVRQILSTGSDLSSSVTVQVEEHFGLCVHNYYGLTETGGVCLLAGVTSDQENAARAASDLSKTALERAAGTIVGRPVGAVVEIVDESGARVPVGVPGEIRVHGANLMMRYVGCPREPQIEPLRGGWFYTGDIAVRRPDGQIELLGRQDERVKDRHGDLLYPEAVAQFIREMDGVGDAAVATLRADGEERLVAFVVPKTPPPDEAIWLARLRQQIGECLGRHKVPSRFIALAQLPHGSTGKVEKKLLLEEHIHALQAH